MSEAVFEDTTNTEGELLNSWSKTYMRARSHAGRGEEKLAREAYIVSQEIEAAMMSAPPSLEAARACIFAAISLMRDESEGDHEPSYAELLRATARHLGLTEIPEPRGAA